MRMRLEKAERAIEAERASVRELQRQLAVARQAPPAPSQTCVHPGSCFTICSLYHPSPAALQRFCSHELARRLARFRILLPVEPSSCLHCCRAKAPRSLCLTCAVLCERLWQGMPSVPHPASYQSPQVSPCSALARRLRQARTDRRHRLVSYSGSYLFAGCDWRGQACAGRRCDRRSAGRAGGGRCGAEGGDRGGGGDGRAEAPGAWPAGEH